MSGTCLTGYALLLLGAAAHSYDLPHEALFCYLAGMFMFSVDIGNIIRKWRNK